MIYFNLFLLEGSRNPSCFHLAFLPHFLITQVLPFTHCFGLLFGFVKHFSDSSQGQLLCSFQTLMYSLQSLTNIKNSLQVCIVTTSKKYKAGLGAYIWTEKGIYHKHILIKKYFNLIEEILSFFFHLPHKR